MTRVVFVAALIVILLIALIAALLGLRYLPLADDVRAVRRSARELAAMVRSLEPAEVDRATLASVRSQLEVLDADMTPIRDVMTGDPLVDILSGVPVVGSQIQGADGLVEAAGALVEAGDLSLALGERVVALREANDADPSVPLLPGLVEIMATSSSDVDRITSLVEGARTGLARVPADALGPIREARDLIAEPLDTYGPMLEAYRDSDEALAALLGWGDRKRYLVLAQNPAELRPTGGYAGTVGIVGFKDGALVEQHFQDVADLDRRTDLPYVRPPDPLVDYLLGEEQAWRLADANWNPDFPTSAQQALEFYELEADDHDVDGVIGITTYALDRLLEVVGPVRVDEFDVTVSPGEVTDVLLDATRGGPRQGRKEVLDALAREVMRRILSLPPDRWVPMLEALQDIADDRSALVWFADDEAQRLAAQAGWTGSLRSDPGDYVYVVEANMSPTSKYNLVIDRSDSLVVKLDEAGGALSSLRLDWQNDAGRPGEPYRSLREYSSNDAGWYGSYVRLLLPADADLITVNGMADDEVAGAGAIEDEAGRMAIGNYLLMPPGGSTLSYLWQTPAVAVPVEDDWEYRLVIQKQPGMRSEQLDVRVDLPDGASVVDVGDGAVADGERVRASADMTSDFELYVRYSLPDDEGGEER